MTLLSLVLIVGTGVLVGSVGIGGFLVVPILLLREGISIKDAVVVATVSFLASGLISLIVWHRSRGAPAKGFMPFLLASGPGAALGALVVAIIVDRALGFVIAIAFASAAVCEWFGIPRTRQRVLGPLRSAVAGALTGFGSVVSGTSGPMVAMPVLSSLGVETRLRVLVAQVAQVPIALAAVFLFWSLAQIPWVLAAQSAAALAIGTLLGVLVGRRLPAHALRRAAAVLMLSAAGYMMARTIS